MLVTRRSAACKACRRLAMHGSDIYAAWQVLCYVWVQETDGVQSRLVTYFCALIVVGLVVGRTIDTIMDDGLLKKNN